MTAEVLQVDSVEEQEVGELDAVDRAETVELKDAGNGIGVFDLREPSIGDMELGIAFSFGDLLAEVRYFTRGDAQTETNGFELFAGGLRPNHGEVYLKTVKGRICNFHGIFDYRQSPMHLELTGKSGTAVITSKLTFVEQGLCDNAASQEQSYVLNELIIALMRKNVLSDLEGKALLQKLLR
jgi:hypothetical protein